MKNAGSWMLRWLGCFAACGAGIGASCADLSPPSAELTGSALDTGCQMPTSETCPDPLEDPCCPGLWCPGPLPEPWWEHGVPPECASALAHEPLEYYDDCYAPGGAREGCGIPGSGAIYCEWSVGPDRHRGVITLTCQTSADCPSGMLCVNNGWPVDAPDRPETTVYLSMGLCEKACTGTEGPAECIRCDRECWTEFGAYAFCGGIHPQHPIIPCTSDCQCVALGAACDGSYCNWIITPTIRGICGPEPIAFDCACTGGTCDESGCCHLPDGTIAAGGEPECVWPQN